MSAKWDIDAWVDRMATSAVTAFYPSLPSKVLNLPINEVVERLIWLACDNRLRYLLEIRCPECSSTIKRFLGGLENAPFMVRCSHCGFEDEFEFEMAIPLFEIVPDYRETVKKKIFH